MPKSLPTFQDGHQTRHPDTCDSFLRCVNAGQVRMEALSRGHYPGRQLPKHVLPGLKMVGFWDADRDRDWGTGWHCNEGIELCFLEAGQMTFSVSEQACPIFPGGITVTQPWLKHSLGNPCVGASRAHWFILDVGVRRRGQPWRWPSWIILTPADRSELASRLEAVPWHAWRAGAEMQRCFLRISHLVEIGEGSRVASLLGILINEALSLLLDALQSQPSVPPDDSEETKRELVQRFWNELRSSPMQLAEPWTPKKMAECCGLGMTQFARYTRQLANIPPLHYLRLCQLNQAARWLIDEPERSIPEIALASGFTSSQYFAKLFQQYFGSTPKMYRAANTHGSR